MKLILGSKSPRRRELLSGMGFDFEIRTYDTDESYPKELRIEEVAAYIAKKKADDLLSSISNDELLICADTIVVYSDKIYGKPLDSEHSFEMLRELSGKTHKVITGVFVGNLIKERVFSVITEVSFKELSNEDIEFYIENYHPFDKAGSYGIQDWFGLTCVTKINGSYTNVVGLPCYELKEVLKTF